MAEYELGMDARNEWQDTVEIMEEGDTLSLNDFIIEAHDECWIVKNINNRGVFTCAENEFNVLIQYLINCR